MEKFKRTRVAILAWAYEHFNVSLVSDEVYDKLALSIDTEVATDRPDLDEWFKNNYCPYTGMWVYRHPNMPWIHSRATEAVKYANKGIPDG